MESGRRPASVLLLPGFDMRKLGDGELAALAEELARARREVPEPGLGGKVCALRRVLLGRLGSRADADSALRVLLLPTFSTWRAEAEQSLLEIARSAESDPALAAAIRAAAPGSMESLLRGSPRLVLMLAAYRQEFFWAGCGDGLEALALRVREALLRGGARKWLLRLAGAPERNRRRKERLMRRLRLPSAAESLVHEIEAGQREAESRERFALRADYCLSRMRREMDGRIKGIQGSI